MTSQSTLDPRSPTPGTSPSGARRKGNRLPLLVAAAGLVAAGVVGAALMSGHSPALAHATIYLDGERIDFELRASAGGVEALVWEGVGLLRSRHVTTKEIHELTPEAARQATFEFDAEKRIAKFTCDEGGVYFTSEGKGWGMLPWISRLD